MNCPTRNRSCDALSKSKQRKKVLLKNASKKAVVFVSGESSWLSSLEKSAENGWLEKKINEMFYEVFNKAQIFLY